MSRDFGVPVVLGLLALAAVFGTATGFLSFALALTAFSALVVFPWIGPHGVRGVGRVGAMAVVTTPFVVFALLEAPRLPGVVLLPAPGWWLALTGGLLLGALSPRRAMPIGVALLALLGLDAVLGHADRPLLPRAWVAAAGPVIEVGWTGKSDLGGGVGNAAAMAWRPGDPVHVTRTPLGEGPGRWYVPAERGRYARSPKLVAVFGAALPSGGDGDIVFIPATELDPDSILALDAFRAIVLLPGEWPAALGEPDRWADALATYTRRGGLLIGPSADRPWPPAIGRRLGASATMRSGDGEARRPYGLGAVVRASSEREVRAAIDARRPGPRLGTVFDGGGGALPSGEALLQRPVRPAGPRGRQSLLLVFYAVVAAALDRILRRGWPRILGAIAPALAVIAGLLWSSPREPGVQAAALAFDLGGGGGRRVEAVLLAAGDAGWRGRVTWQGGGLVRLAGGRLEDDGRVRLGPAERAWVIRETVAAGGFAGGRESPDEGYLLRFVRGEVDPARVTLGRLDALPVEIEGLGPPEAATLTAP